jgi:hypothetical protein
MAVFKFLKDSSRSKLHSRLKFQAYEIWQMLVDIQFRILYLLDCCTEAKDRSPKDGGDGGPRGFPLFACCYIPLRHPLVYTLQPIAHLSSEVVISNVRVKRKARQFERNIEEYAGGGNVQAMEMWRDSFHGTSFRGLTIVKENLDQNTVDL